MRRDLGLKREQIPSKNQDLVSILVEKAALGIIEEGKLLEKTHEAEFLAGLLREQKNKRMEEVWRYCAYLYSLESFLYKKLNETMGLIGDQGHEEVWRSKVRTLGPFGLLLWDDPINKRLKIRKNLYRGANLKPEQLAIYEDMAKHQDDYRSFQAFTSCSRNRAKAEPFGKHLVHHGGAVCLHSRYQFVVSVCRRRRRTRSTRCLLSCLKGLNSILKQQNT